jgi:hypothetical protein
MAQAKSLLLLREMKADAAATDDALDDRVYVACRRATEPAERLAARRKTAGQLITPRNTPGDVESRNVLLNGTARVDRVRDVKLIAPDMAGRRSSSWTGGEHDCGANAE